MKIQSLLWCCLAVFSARPVNQKIEISRSECLSHLVCESIGISGIAKIQEYRQGAGNFRELRKKRLKITVRTYSRDEFGGELFEALERKSVQRFDGSGKCYERVLDYENADEIPCFLPKHLKMIVDRARFAEDMFTAIGIDDYEAAIALTLAYPNIDIDYQRQSDGKTPLMEAVESVGNEHWKDFVQLLLDHGAKTSIADDKMNTIFSSPALDPEKLEQHFEDLDVRAKKVAEADAILQMLIQRAS